MYKVYLVIFDLDIEKGGKTTSLLTRAQMFNRHNLNANIVTFDYKNDYPEVVSRLRKIGKLDNQTEVFNQFEHFEERSLKLIKSRYNINKEMLKFFKKQTKFKINSKTYKFLDNKTGEYTGEIVYSDNIKDFTLKLYNNHNLVKKIYCKNNIINRIKEFNSEEKLTGELFYNRKGQPFLRRTVNKNTKIIEDVFLISENKNFKNNKELSSYFLDTLIEDNSDNVIILDGTGSLNRILETNHKKVQKYAVLHTDYKNVNGNFKKVEDNVLKNSEKLTGVVFLTQDYINDAKNDYSISNDYLIHNFIKEMPDEYEMTESNIVGCIARLSPNKGFDLLIEVAKKVKNTNDEIEFHIYGEGDYKNTIIQMIKENNLETTVKTFGYTTQPYETLKNFRCVITTSQSEVQSLSMLEAMLAGKPVISFDIKYGPSQFIFNDYNGYLIENKNTSDMANAVIDIMSSEDKYKIYGERSRKMVLEQFNPESIVNDWIKVFDENNS